LIVGDFAGDEVVEPGELASEAVVLELEKTCPIAIGGCGAFMAVRDALCHGVAPTAEQRESLVGFEQAAEGDTKRERAVVARLVVE